MAEQVIRTFDLYNTDVLLPNYTIAGYENEFNITRGYYSTNFSSNPIGSKIDFFVQLDSPCTGIVATSATTPNPVFNVPTALTALNPLWYDKWWDEAMYYSHPKVIESIQASNPSLYQPFSDSVGSLYFPSQPSLPINSALQNKLPKNILTQITKLRKTLNTNFSSYIPTGFGPVKTKYTAQYTQFINSTDTIKNAVNSKFAPLKNKLPMNVTQVGNLITPSTWKYNTNIQGVNTAVNRLGNVTSAPKRLYSGAINKGKSVIPKITLPAAVGKMIAAARNGMAAANNIFNNLKTATGALQTTVATAQGAVAKVSGSVGKLTDITRGVSKNTTIAAMTKQYPDQATTLANNALLVKNTSNTTTIKTYTKGAIPT